VTVLDDAAVDTLIGEGGRDWFFLLGLDVLTDMKKNEFVN
jgi:hypothetical protein